LGPTSGPNSNDLWTISAITGDKNLVGTLEITLTVKLVAYS
jgi:hypothetical protein